MKTNRFLIYLAVILIPFTELKLFNIKIYEFYYSLLLLLFFLHIMYDRNFTIKTNDLTPLFKRVLFYFILIYFFIVLITLYSFHDKFYPPAFANEFLRLPIIVSFARFFQLALCIFIMYLIVSSIDDILFFKRILFLYICLGFLLSFYGLILYLLLKFYGIYLFGAYDVGDGLIRIRSTFAEGGSFGLYLASVIIILLYHRNMFCRKTNLLIYCPLLYTFYLTHSKSGIIALILLALIGNIHNIKQVFTLSKLKEIFVTIILIGLLVIINYSYLVSIAGYINARELLLSNASEVSGSQIGSVFYGRVAASIIIPNMIKDRPFTGIGLGNYSVKRNNPKYLGPLPEVTGWDLSGLGILDLAAEVGIPLFLAFVMVLLIGIRYAIKYKCHYTIIMLASFQLVAHLMGLQITFIYPWFITAVFFCILKLQIVDKSCS